MQGICKIQLGWPYDAQKQMGVLWNAPVDILDKFYT